MTDATPRTRFPKTLDRSSASGHGDTRIIVTGDSPDAVCAVNRGIATIDAVARRTNPDAVPAPRVTGMISAYDLGRRAYHSICLRRLDYRLRRAPTVGEVVVFSEPQYAPGRTNTLQLATPAYYRDHEGLEPGIRDQHDGTLTRDGSPWATSSIGGTVNARMSFASSVEPWVYCASHYRFSSDLRRLRSEFNAKYDYSAATQILDADAFAAWLGVEFALGFDKSADVSLDWAAEAAYAGSSYTTNLW